MKNNHSELVNKPHLVCAAHYYIPDEASTGQILAELAEGLLDTFRVTVICVVPSYTGTVPEDYKTQKYYFETINGVEIIRVRVPEFQKSNKISRVKNIVTYFFRALHSIGKISNIDYFLSVSQPPILGGLLGVWAKWSKGCKFIYQIQDFNPEQILAVNYSKNQLLTKLMMVLDKFSCNHSDLVITVGRDLVDTLKSRFQGKKCPNVTMINNWIDEKTIYPLQDNDVGVVAFKEKYGLTNKFIFMYSGNIGLYYDLENIIKVIEKIKPGTTTSDGREVVFAFVGAGSVLEQLVAYKETHGMNNVVFIPYQPKSELIYSLNAADVHWCVNAKGIKGVSCPSKYYGLAACAKPILGVLEAGSEIRCLIEDTQGGCCSEPGDLERIRIHIQWFIDHAGTREVAAMGQRGYENLVKNLTRKASITKYSKVILENVPSEGISS